MRLTKMQIAQATDSSCVYVDGQKHLLSALNTKQNHLCPIEIELIEPVKAVFLFSAWQGLQIEAVQVYNHSSKGYVRGRTLD